MGTHDEMEREVAINSERLRSLTIMQADLAQKLEKHMEWHESSGSRRFLAWTAAIASLSSLGGWVVAVIELSQHTH